MTDSAQSIEPVLSAETADTADTAARPVVVPSAPPAPLPGPEALAPGSLIGGYRVVERIDQGAEAALYRVAPVAAGESRFRGLAEGGVIVLLAGRRARIEADRFAEAARRLAGIERPALARPLHGGVTSERRVWAVYGELAGEPLDAYCDAHRIGLAQRVSWLAEVLEALTSAHSQLVLHGFLAPELVRVVETGGVPGVVVLGFGLHALAGSSPVTADLPAELGARLPASLLASPEELLGEPVSVASDVYRAGLLLRRLLLGGSGDQDLVASDAESRVRAMVERATTDPSDAFLAFDAEQQAAIAERRATTPAELARALQGDLGRLLAATLAEAADDRPRSADAVARRLRAWPSAAQPAPAGERPRRNRRPVAAILVAIVAGLGGWIAWQGWSRAARSAEDARLEARVERSLTEAFGLAGWSPGSPDEQSEQSEPDEGLPPALAARLRSEDAAFAVAALDRLGEVAAQRGDASALALHERAFERAAGVYGESSFEAARSLLRGARSAVALGSADAESWSRRAFHAINGLGGRRPIEELEAGLLLGGAVAGDEPERALDLADRALERLDRAAGIARWLGLGASSLPAGFDHERARLEARLLRSRALLATGSVEAAREELERAAAAPALADSPALAADLWSVRALILERAAGSPEERVSALEQEVEARARLHGERAAPTLDAARRLAEALAAAGRQEGAIARTIRSAELAAEPAQGAGAWEQAGRLQIDAGRPLDAIDSLDKALGGTVAGTEDETRRVVLLATAALRAGRPEIALARLDLASLATAEGPGARALLRAARARALAALGRAGAGVALREALEELRLAETDETPAAAPLLVALGERLTAEGEAIVAEAYLRRALSILQQAGAAGYLIAEAESALGEGLLAQGRAEEAGELLRRASAALAARDDEPARAAQRRVELLGRPATGA